MKIRVERLDESQKPVISHVWCTYESKHCVVLCVDLHKKRQEPTAYQGPSVWLGNERLVVEGLPFSATVFAETSRYTCFVTLIDRGLDEFRNPKVLWDNEDNDYSPWPPKEDDDEA